MLPFQERKKLRKILYSKASLIALGILLFFVASGAWNIYQKAVIARSERDRAERALVDLQVRTAELTASLARLQSDQGVEEDVRQKFTVAKPGEDVVVVVDDTSKKSENSQAGQTKSLWARIISVFGF
jgi:cell division protein FtsB